VTHALFDSGALGLLRSAGVSQIWSTDCIEHSSNAVSMAASLAQAVALIEAAKPGQYQD
jgi:ribose-phosphate pyrophosphokinase